MLLCPKCGSLLYKEEQSYQCVHHHSFDIAKRGYVNLLLGNHKSTGDDKKMVKARTKFLQHGYYSCLQLKVIEMLQQLEVHSLVDAGCGEGYYTNAIQTNQAIQGEIYGFDLAKTAVDEACKAHAGVIYGVCNIFHIPLAEASMDAYLSMFAPYDVNEISRVLKNKGYFLKVAPGKKHLWEMKEMLYEHVYENELVQTVEGFHLIQEDIVEAEIHIQNQEDIIALLQMTPYYWKTPKAASEAFMQKNELTTRIQFHLALFQKDELNRKP